MQTFLDEQKNTKILKIKSGSDPVFAQRGLLHLILSLALLDSGFLKF